MLVTSARSGEVLAIRKCDVDVTVSPATVRLSGTIVSPTGKPTHRQPHPKTAKSARTVAVPRSEEHTSELQSRAHDGCRHLLEKKTAARRGAHGGCGGRRGGCAEQC